ncbi:TOBE domain-containing protein (plasmid) [Paroceanicella profunda]|uniref:TOBE domain-containing protein n=1 Tax=Paroceanicella profunda TaxID=2579971 RepID=A0A5B8G6B8_9RHOB|nr:TOBE domain-containing protein [Paroceanicella profunda]
MRPHDLVVRASTAQAAGPGAGAGPGGQGHIGTGPVASGGHAVGAPSEAARTGAPQGIPARAEPSASAPSQGPAALTLTGTVTAVEPLGPETLVHFTGPAGPLIATAAARLIPEIGSEITASAAPGTVLLFDPATEKAMGRR